MMAWTYILTIFSLTVIVYNSFMLRRWFRRKDYLQMGLGIAIIPVAGATLVLTIYNMYPNRVSPVKAKSNYDECKDAPPEVPYRPGMTLCPGQRVRVLPLGQREI